MMSPAFGFKNKCIISEIYCRTSGALVLCCF